MKTCRTCLQEKPKDTKHFYVRRELRDGFMSSCKACVDERNRQWAQKNSERLKELKRAKEKRRRERNLDHVRFLEKTRRAEARRADPEKHRPKRRAETRLRRARMKGAFVEDVDLWVVYERDGGICYLCSLPVSFNDSHLDHVIPVSRGGEHSYKNVRTTHGLCNRVKGSRILGSDPQIHTTLPR